MSDCLYCSAPAVARGLCTIHWRRWRNQLPMEAPVLCLCGCGKRCYALSSGYCLGHRVDIVTYRKIGIRGEHLIRAEAALGKSLPLGAEVHHVTGTKSDRSPLVICQNHAYHKWLHVRMRVLRAGGNPDRDAWCYYCKCPRPVELFWPRRDRPSAYRPLVSICKRCEPLKRAERNRAATA